MDNTNNINNQTTRSGFENYTQNQYIQFTNDFMFCSVLENTELCKEFLERILNIKITKIRCVCKQKTIKNLREAKGIRLDVYVTDIYGNSYDIEMQTTSFAELPLRIRYYHSEMDEYSIRQGMDYIELGKNIVIFVCTYDPFNYGDSIYTFKSTCQEHNSLLLDDKIETIILNVNGTRNKTNKKLNNLLDFIKTGVCKDKYTKKLASKVEQLNTDNDWRDKYMTFEWKLMERERLGREEGREEGKLLKSVQLVKNAIANAISLDSIESLLGDEPETVEHIYDLITEYGLDYDNEKLVKMLLK